MIEEYVDSEDEDAAEEEEYDYSQHIKQMGSGNHVGFSVFVHKNGTIVPTATMNKSDADEQDAANADNRLRLDRKSIKAMKQPTSSALASSSSNVPNAAAARLGLDASLFAARSAIAEEEGRFMQKFGNIASDAFVDADIMEELEEAMRHAQEADGELDEELPDDFVAIANASDSENGNDEDDDDNSFGEGGSDLDIDIDEELPVKNAASCSLQPRDTTVDASRNQPKSEQMQILEEKFKRELAEFDEDDDFDGDDDDEDQDPSQFKGATDISAFEGVLDEFLEQRSKTYLDGFDRPTSSSVIPTHDSSDESGGDESESDDDLDPREFLNPDDELEVVVVPVADRYNNDDCESVLSSYTNTENHPRLLDEVPRPSRIRFNKQGIPSVAPTGPKPKKNRVEIQNAPAAPVRRKDESSEEKKARKQALKEQRRQNRERKKELKTAFRQEEVVQKKIESRRATVINY